MNIEIEVTDKNMMDKGSLYLHEAVGTAKGENNEYEMVLINMNTMGIKSKQTGKTFALSWQQLGELAIKAGIDDE